MLRPCSRLLVALTGVLALSVPAQPAHADGRAAPVFDLCAAVPVPCDLPLVTGTALPAAIPPPQLPPKDCVTTGYKAGPFRYAGYLIAGFATQTDCASPHTLEAQVTSIPAAVVTSTSKTRADKLCLGETSCDVSTSWASSDPGPICYENEGVTYYTDDYANTAFPTGSVAGVICA